MNKPLVIAILAKSVAHVLPLYLKSIEQQTVIDENTIFYIRTNDNKDNTTEILKEWIEKMKDKHEIYFDDSSVYPELQNIDNHDWSNHHRFKVLGEIRQKSIDFAIEKGADYFIADADNIVHPHTIERLRSLNLGAVSPMIRQADPTSLYANYHAAIDDNGYYVEIDEYFKYLYYQIKGIIEQPVIHCTYFISNETLPFVSYDDNTGRYEYVIFSHSLRKANIPQYLDNREFYGVIFNSINEEEYAAELEHPDSQKVLAFYNC